MRAFELRISTFGFRLSVIESFLIFFCMFMNRKSECINRSKINIQIVTDLILLMYYALGENVNGTQIANELWL